MLIDGKHQGGRAPYGYRVVDAGPHPNPRKVQEGYRLRVLAIDELAAPAVERIYAMYLEGLGFKAIAETLNAEGTACPSAHSPKQNRHRSGHGWQSSTVKAILDNPRYTGFAVYGRWRKVEELLDPENVAAGHVVRFRRSPTSKIVRSREAAHAAIVSLEDFTRVQLEIRARREAGLRDQTSRERVRVRTPHTYLFKGRVRCSICTRKMEGAMRRNTEFCRCAARTLAPGASASLEHPPTVYLRVDQLSTRVNDWIAKLFSPEYLDATVDELTAAVEEDAPADRTEADLKRRIAAAEATMWRLRRALEAGWDPAEMTAQYNAAVAEKRAAEAGLATIERPQRLTPKEIRAMVDQLGDIAQALDCASQRTG
ncbi:recombinase family protein [Kribbella sp. NBC_00359]|uniref:recombinase family protein n=1 Tax=Kribbella sp. NBC_00359 TaxID=2975966 RepID=UPI002E232686